MTDATPEMVGTFRWAIPGWSSRTEKHFSEKFDVGGVSWGIMLFLRGKLVSGYVSIFLYAVDAPPKPLTDNWQKYVSYSLTIKGAKKHDDENAAAVSARAIRLLSGHTFTKGELIRGWRRFVSLTTLNDPDKGLVSLGDTVVITAEVCVMNKTLEGVSVSCHEAAAHGDLETLKYLRDFRSWDVATCAAAAWIGNLEILKWAREHGCPWDKRTCENAARNGHLELLKWARENGAPWDEQTCAYALKGKHSEVARYYIRNVSVRSR